jgi:hypothetical protein
VDVFDARSREHVASFAADGSGRYVADGLEPASYLVVLSNAHAQAFVGYFPSLYRDQPLYRLERAKPVIVAPGQTTHGVDAALVAFYDDFVGTTFQDDIFWMQAAGITRGCDSTSFCPDEPVTRGQTAAFLHRALAGLETGPPATFADDDASIFEDDIEWLARAGVALGCNPPANTRFCPDDAITRGQMAAFLVRALRYDRAATDNFSDDDGSVFEEDINRLAAAGVTTGCGTRLFCPGGAVTRGQMAAFLHRALDSRVPSTGTTSGIPVLRPADTG